MSSTSHYPAAPAAQGIETHTLSVIVDNEPGVLARVIGLFSGRGYNIDSLTVSETEHEKHLSRITIVTRGTPMVIEQIKNQLDRLVPVHRVVDMTRGRPAIQRELAMVKVRGKGEPRVEALAAGRRLPRPRHRRRHRELHLRDHRRERQDRQLHQPDAAARPGRGVAHRHRRDRARAGGDVDWTTIGLDIHCISRREKPMKVTIAKWGNSIGVRLPKSVAARTCGLSLAAQVDMSMERQ